MRFEVTVLVKAKLHRSLKGELKEQDAQLRQNVISSDRPDEGQIDGVVLIKF